MKRIVRLFCLGAVMTAMVFTSCKKDDAAALVAPLVTPDPGSSAPALTNLEVSSSATTGSTTIEFDEIDNIAAVIVTSDLGGELFNTMALADKGVVYVMFTESIVPGEVLTITAYDRFDMSTMEAGGNIIGQTVYTVPGAGDSGSGSASALTVSSATYSSMGLKLVVTAPAGWNTMTGKATLHVFKEDGTTELTDTDGVDWSMSFGNTNRCALSGSVQSGDKIIIKAEVKLDGTGDAVTYTSEAVTIM